MSETYKVPTARLLLGDCRAVLASLATASIDAVVTDPPYGIGFKDLDWDKPWLEASLDRKRDHTAQAKADGFRSWMAPIMFELLRVLKPGGHLVAFGGTRTVHWLATSIEGAGFEIRDQLGWIYGAGSEKQIALTSGDNDVDTVLDPDWDPIVLARKPVSETTLADNVSRWGTGRIAINNPVISGVTVSDRRQRFFDCARTSASDRDEGCDILNSDAVNHHPTVKPTDLMRALCCLVTPRGGVVLDPFCGSGSTGKAALLEGFKFIGVERDESYVPVAQARLAYAVRVEAAAV